MELEISLLKIFIKLIGYSMKLRLLIGIICTFSVLELSGQTIQGRLIDNDNQPVTFANIILMTLPDSTFVSGTISNEQGQFSIEGNGQLLKISSIGYTTIYYTCDKGDLGMINMNVDTQLLDEVVVKGDLPKTRVKGEAMLTTVAGTLLEKAGTAENLLDKIPTVSAKDGEVRVFGRGTPEIYINGRKVRDMSELDQLSSDNVKSVEVINNPGARYNANVKSVIRISTKKTLGDGFGFNNRAFAKYNKKWSLLDQFNFNYRKGGFDFMGMLLASDAYAWSKKETVQDTYLDKHWVQKSYIDEKEHIQNINTMLAANYVFNENSTVGIRYNMNRMPKYDSDNIMPIEVFQNGTLTERMLNPGFTKLQRTRQQLNLYYTGNIGKWNIDFNADGLWGKENRSDYTEEMTEYADGETSSREVSSFNDIKNSLYAAKLILSYPLWEGDFSIGGEYSYVKRTNDYRNPEGILNDNKNKIKETGSAVFIEYARAFGKTNLQLGARFENVLFDYYEGGKLIEEQSKTYTNFFPSLALSFPVGAVQMLMSYATDITRPSYHQLRGNIVYNDRYTYETGNPLLHPSLTHNVTLGMSYKWFQFSAGYQHIKDAIIFDAQTYSVDDPTIALIKMINAPAYDNIFASFVLSPTIAFWSPQLSLQMQKQWYTTETSQGQRKLNNPIGILSLNNSFELPWGIQLDVDGSWMTCGYSENQQLKNNQWGIDIMLYKSFIKNRLTFQLRGNDLFDTMATKAVIYCGAIRTLSSDIKSNSRSISLTVRYKFNSTKSKYKGTGAGESQKNRM